MFRRRRAKCYDLIGEGRGVRVVLCWVLLCGCLIEQLLQFEGTCTRDNTTLAESMRDFNKAQIEMFLLRSVYSGGTPGTSHAQNTIAKIA